MSRYSRAVAWVDSGASWFCIEGQELVADYGTVKPIQADSYHVEKDQNWQMEAMDRCINTTSAIIDSYKEHHASERSLMDTTVNQIKKECKGYKLSVIRVRAARKLFHARMNGHRDEKEKSLRELANQSGINYTPRQVAKDKIKGPTTEIFTQLDHTEGKPTPERMREEYAEETIEEERNHRLNTAARRRLERTVTPYSARGTPKLMPRRRFKITRDKVLSN